MKDFEEIISLKENKLVSHVAETLTRLAKCSLQSRCIIKLLCIVCPAFYVPPVVLLYRITQRLSTYFNFNWKVALNTTSKESRSCHHTILFSFAKHGYVHQSVERSFVFFYLLCKAFRPWSHLPAIVRQKEEEKEEKKRSKVTNELSAKRGRKEVKR